VIYGARSAYFNDQEYERFKKYYPTLERENCHKIDDAGHWVHIDNIDQFCRTLDIILKKDAKSS
jgi:pimeloyl-ACP methyl ester carboxylesterase